MSLVIVYLPQNEGLCAPALAIGRYLAVDIGY
jgi:hypothetical protein